MKIQSSVSPKITMFIMTSKLSRREGDIETLKATIQKSKEN